MTARKILLNHLMKKNKIFENNNLNINFNYNVVEDIVVVIKTENETLQNIVFKENFRNDHIKKNVFNENTKFSIK